MPRFSKLVATEIDGKHKPIGLLTKGDYSDGKMRIDAGGDITEWIIPAGGHFVLAVVGGDGALLGAVTSDIKPGGIDRISEALQTAIKKGNMKVIGKQIISGKSPTHGEDNGNA